MGQIALDPFSLQFRFAHGGQITAEGRIEHVDKDGQAHPYVCQDGRGTAVYLHQLLQHRITKVEAESFRLSLIFDDGSTLHIFGDIGPYECGQIHPPGLGQQIIIF